MRTARRFWEHRPEELGDRATFYVDGGVWPTNPGHGGIGVVAVPEVGGRFTESSYLGDCVTNNTAEYAAVMRALELAVEFRLAYASIRSDSQLVVRQLNGEYATRKFELDRLREEFWEKARQLASVEVLWVPREQNVEANALVKELHGHDWGPTGTARVNGKDALLDYVEGVLREHGFSANREPVAGGTVRIGRAFFATTPFYERQNGEVLPAMELQRLNVLRALDQQYAVVLVWRPMGMGTEARFQPEELGWWPRHVVPGVDRGFSIEPLFAYLSGMDAEPALSGARGYSGTPVYVFRQPERHWLSVRYFLWWHPNPML